MSWYVNTLFAEVAAPNSASFPWYVDLLVALATLAVSFFLGGYLGKTLRMRDHGWKIGLSLFTLLASVVVLLMGPPLKLGIDLSGGVILVYEVDQSKVKSTDTIDMDKLIGAVARRVNPGGQKEVTIRKFGTQQIEVIVPEVDQAEVDRIKRIISTTGNLEFRILANQRHDKEWIERAQADSSKMQVRDPSGNVLAWWVPVKPGQEQGFLRDKEIVTRVRKVGGKEILEVLVDNDIYNVTGAYLTRAEAGADDRGQPCVHFNFNIKGAGLFGELTGTHLPEKLTDFAYRLGIILDGQLCSAPTIQSQITDRGQITGSFTQQEVQELVNVLNAGSLPVALSKEPISELYSGPTLGGDTITKSTHAMLIAAVLVPLFMLWYYRFSGLVADIALVLNMLMLFAVMLTIKAAFTLTGFAGLALTVGMAVDNNVLIYERLREELDRGATLRMAIRNAFQRASAVIIDANITTLLAATVLYIIGSDQVKGFAVTLWLGVAISMYTAVFVSRVIFDVAEKRQWITHVKMLRMIGHTNIDFMHWFRYCLTGSIIVTVMAIAVAFYRGQGLFDIDFTGGVSVQAYFEKPQDTAYVRDALRDKLPDLAISDVQLAGEQKGLRFLINTSQSDMDKVRSVLSATFGDKLARNAVQFTVPKAITAPASAKPVKDGQSRRELSSSSLLASADQDAWMLALADPPTAKKAATKPKAPAPVEKPAPAKAVEVPASKAAATYKPSPVETKQPEGATVEKAAEPDPFVGGSQAELTFAKPVNYDAVVQMLSAALDKNKVAATDAVYRLSNDGYVEGQRTAYPQWTLKILLQPAEAKAVLATLQQQVADSPIFPASNTIGAAVAGNTRTQAIYALVASWICMIVYLWIRFQGAAFGIAAVVALIHDVFVILGAIAVSIYVAPYLGFLMIEPFKINLPIVAAFLTIIGYSVNDTIVVFDRIREVRGKNPDLTRKMVNDSTNQTLSRTLLTSFTVLLVVVVLYLFGGEAVHGFAFALIVGVATGTYSSIYVASPILLWLVGKHEGTKAVRANN
ncbi:MAG: protein translocase subunit SecD [Thermoguttaceae bacterium]